MSLNKQSGNMYPWVTHTWNPIQGRCPHQCSYCYMKKIWDLQGSQEQVFKEKYLHGDKGEGKTIFVGSSTDIWVAEPAWLRAILNHCREFPGNTYVFQSKNPFLMIGFDFPPHTIVGTTIESDCQLASAYVPTPSDRAVALAYLHKYQGLRTMVSIEPIMEFNLPRLIIMIQICEPEFVSIGADSKGNCLPEPHPDKVQVLIKELGQFTEVREKQNLERIIGGGYAGR